VLVLQHLICRQNMKIFTIAISQIYRIYKYGAVCWDPYRECQISALDRVQNKAAKFAHHSGGSEWESLAQCRKIARMCALYKAYTRERAWKTIGDRLQAPSYLTRSLPKTTIVDLFFQLRALRPFSLNLLRNLSF
jgi:hypothetical protein